MLSQKKKVCSKCEKELTIDNFHKERKGKFGVRSVCNDCRKKQNNPVNTDINIKQTCGDCGEELPATLEYFHRNKRGKFGVKTKCKECLNKKRKEKNNPINTDVRIKQTCSDCNKEFPATLDYFYRNKQGKFGVGAQCKKCCNKRFKQWKKDNPEYYSEYEKDRYHNDEQFRIQKLLSKGLRHALNRIGQSKNASILQYIGCDIAFLQQHLNSTIDDSWGDVKLDIDHIIPVSSYDHTNEEEKKKCWNWRNLRYFPKSDNISKGNILDMALVENYGISDLLPDF